MLIGVPKEIKVHEYRVGLTPTNVREVVAHGHQALVETGAGGGIGIADRDYEAAGATIVASAKEIFERAEMIVKVKEPQASERKQLHKGQVLFTQAYRLTESNLVAPFEYTAMIWATLWGFLLFGDFPDWTTGAGAALVIGAGLYMLGAARRRRPG